MKTVALPSGKQSCNHGPAVNVPSKVDSVCTLLPRLPSQTDLIPLKLKWKLTYKKHYLYNHVRPDKVLMALNWLKCNNPLYSSVSVNSDWVNESSVNNSELFNSLTADSSLHNSSSISDQNSNPEPTCMVVNEELSNDHLTVLCSRAKTHGFKIHDVPGDGNCLFSSITYQLSSEYRK